MNHKFYPVVALAEIALASGPLLSQVVVQITSPASRTIVNPGQTIVVDVSVSGTGFLGAKIAAQDPIKDSQVLTAPPYQFSITVPARIRPGPYTLVAEGRTSSGRQSSDPVTIDVERTDTPQSIAADSHVELAVGDESLVRVVGTYADGSVVDLSRSTRTTYSPDPPGIVSVTREGVVTALAAGSTKIVIQHQNHKTVVKAVVGHGPR
jgi:hypothetical protein